MIVVNRISSNNQTVTLEASQTDMVRKRPLKISVYDYPEHLNPFREEEEMERRAAQAALEGRTTRCHLLPISPYATLGRSTKSQLSPTSSGASTPVNGTLRRRNKRRAPPPPPPVPIAVVTGQPQQPSTPPSPTSQDLASPAGSEKCCAVGSVELPSPSSSPQRSRPDSSEIPPLQQPPTSHVIPGESQSDDTVSQPTDLEETPQPRPRVMAEPSSAETGPIEPIEEAPQPSPRVIPVDVSLVMPDPEEEPIIDPEDIQNPEETPQSSPDPAELNQTSLDPQPEPAKSPQPSECVDIVIPTEILPEIEENDDPGNKRLSTDNPDILENLNETKNNIHQVENDNKLEVCKSKSELINDQGENEIPNNNKNELINKNTTENEREIIFTEEKTTAFEDDKISQGIDDNDDCKKSDTLSEKNLKCASEETLPYIDHDSTSRVPAQLDDVSNGHALEDLNPPESEGTPSPVPRRSKSSAPASPNFRTNNPDKFSPQVSHFEIRITDVSEV